MSFEVQTDAELSNPQAVVAARMVHSAQSSAETSAQTTSLAQVSGPDMSPFLDEECPRPLDSAAHSKPEDSTNGQPLLNFDSVVGLGEVVDSSCQPARSPLNHAFSPFSLQLHASESPEFGNNSDGEMAKHPLAHPTKPCTTSENMPLYAGPDEVPKAVSIHQNGEVPLAPFPTPPWPGRFTPEVGNCAVAGRRFVTTEKAPVLAVPARIVGTLPSNQPNPQCATTDMLATQGTELSEDVFETTVHAGPKFPYLGEVQDDVEDVEYVGARVRPQFPLPNRQDDAVLNDGNESESWESV